MPKFAPTQAFENWLYQSRAQMREVSIYTYTPIEIAPATASE